MKNIQANIYKCSFCLEHTCVKTQPRPAVDGDGELEHADKGGGKQGSHPEK